MMRVTYYSSVLLLLVTSLNSCKKNTSQTDVSKHSANVYCYVPSDSLIGKEFLENKFLEGIEAVKSNEQTLNNTDGMVLIKGGVFDMGGDMPENPEGMPNTALPQSDEFPKHSVKLSDFYMDEHEVTVGEFMEFINATGYKTVAEYDIDWEELRKQLPPGTPKPDENTLKAGALVFHYPPMDAPKDDLTNWWTFKQGANWMKPQGLEIDLNAILKMPVTQVSWYDAMAYAKWVNKRLPTEAEYEYAMRGGSKNTMYPWGNETLKNTSYKGNFLQGDFPYNNTGEDGFEKTAPVKSFEPNAYGLYDIAGNVWEWTMDWYGRDYYKILKEQSNLSVDPMGPNQTNEINNDRATNKVVRGGSFLCNDSWCSGFRNARRMRLSPDSGMQHVGFRCVRPVQ